MAAVVRRAVVALALSSSLAVRALAQGSPTVAPGDPAYADARRLLDHGLAPGIAVSQLPWSRRTFTRIHRAACPQLGSGEVPSGAPSIVNACHRLRWRFADAVGPPGPEAAPAWMVQPLAELRAGALYTDAPARGLEGNGLGTTEADLRPLTALREGRRYATGTNATLESAHWARFGSHLTLEARPRLWLAAPRGGDADAALELRTASARLVAANVAITLGREHTDWGNAPGGGLFFSANGPPLDMIRVATEEPFRLPSVLGRLGPTSATVQLANVGPSASHSHSRLAAYKVSIQPATTVELGATFANHFGGAGSIDPGLGRRIVDLLPFVDVFRRHNDSTEFDSDKKLGIDARARVPRLGNATLFAELALEDFDVHRLRSVLTEDAAWILGVRLPSLGAPSLSAQFSYHATGIRFYEHHLMQNGYASRRFLLGDPLGRDASGWYGAVAWESPGGLTLRALSAYESRGNSEFIGGYTQPGLKGLVFRVVTPRPAELRRRLVVDATQRSRDGRRSVSLGAGVERVSGPPLAPLGGRTGALLEAGLSVFR